MEQPSSPSSGNRPRREPEYSNPPVAEGINVSDKSPLRTFLINLAITTAGLIVLLLLLNFVAVLLAPFIPFSWERRLVPASAVTRFTQSGGLGREDAARQEELRRLAARIGAAMDLPDGVSVTVYYSPDKTTNAFALLGGNIVVFRGLLELMESEDELAMVMAHEIGHVKNRDAVKGAMRAVGLMFLFAGIQDSGAYVQNVVSVGMAKYSRSQEEAADAEAVRALIRLYGHAGGADAFFRTIARKLEGRDADTSRKAALPAILASHPDTLDRIASVRKEAEKHGAPQGNALTPLPDALVFD